MSHEDVEQLKQQGAQLRWQIRCTERALAELKDRREADLHLSCLEAVRGIPQDSAAFEAFAEAAKARTAWQCEHGPGPVSDVAAVELAALNAAVETAAHEHDLALRRRRGRLAGVRGLN